MEPGYDTFLLYLAYLLVVAGIIALLVKLYGRLVRKKKNIRRGLVKRFK